MRSSRLAERNAKALSARSQRRHQEADRASSTNDPRFHELKCRHPYFGYIEVQVYDVTPFLMLSNNDDRVAQMYFWYGPDAFEPLSLRLWSRLVEGADTIFDVGAFTGVYSLAAVTKSPQSDVHAFEPIRRVFGRLVDNLVVNTVGTRVQAHNVALSDTEGDEHMQLFRGHRTLSGGSSLVGKPMMNALDQELVRTVRADKLARDLDIDEVDLLKIDVEGAECLVVDGLGDLLADGPDMIIEVSSVDTLHALLERLGTRYDFVVLNDRRQRAFVGKERALRPFSNVFFTTRPRRETESLLDGLTSRAG